MTEATTDAGSGATVDLVPIRSEDLADVAEFLSRTLDNDVLPSTWHGWLTPPWAMSAENRGFMLRANGAIVGAYVAYYTTRDTRIGPIRFCNLADWSVLDEYRAHSLRLVLAIVKQPGLTFTDFTPGSATLAVNRRLGFVDLDTSGFVAPALPFTRRYGWRVVDDSASILRVLNDRDRAEFLDHGADNAVALVDPSGIAALVMMRTNTVPVDHLRGLRVRSAHVWHVSDRQAFRAGYSALATHLFIRGVFAITAETRIAGFVPALARSRPNPEYPRMRPQVKQYKSSELQDDDIDYLYAESQG